MSNPVILWRESMGYGSLVWSQVYVRLDRNSTTRGDLNVGNAGTLKQWGRGSGSDQGWAMQGGTVGSLGIRATTLGFSGAIDTNAMSNNKVGVAFAYNQGGNVGGSILAEFWDDDSAGDGSFVHPLLHLTIETLNDGRICARNGTGAAFGNHGTIIGTSTFVVPVGLNGQAGNYTHIEVTNPVIHATAGSVQVYADGTLVLDVSGAATRNVVAGSGKIGYIQVNADNGRLATDVIFHDCSGSGRIGDKRVTYRKAAVAGTYTAGTASGAGTRLACVSEQAADGDTTKVIFDDSALPKKVSFTTEAMPANTVSIDEVTEHVIVRKTDASANTGRYGMKSGATEVDNGSDLSTPTGYNVVTQVGPAVGHQLDPNTSVSWVIADCDAAEIIYERVA